MASTGPKAGYLPSLDGWRALAVIAVVLNHDRHLADGFMGVYIFFAISGLLITWRILEDESSIGRFDLRGFYVRRIFRIHPAALAFLATIALLIAGATHNQWRYWFAALLSYRNSQEHLDDLTLSNRYSWFTGHFWTLSVEEHFYVLLSLFFYFIRRHRLTIMVAFLSTLLLLQRLAVSHGFYSTDISPWRTYWIIQFLIFPSTLALALQKQTFMRGIRRYCHPWIIFTVTLLPLALHRYLAAPGARLRADPINLNEHTWLYYSFALWIMSTTFHPFSLSTKLLELPPVRFVGRLSYSIYLWQQIFIRVIAPSTIVLWKPLLFFSGAPQRYLATFVAAVGSYFLLEKPLIRLGHRLAPPATPGHSDLAIGEETASAKSLETI